MDNHEKSQNNIEDEVVETFSITAEEAIKRFDNANVPRSPSSITRDCQNGNLSCRKLAVNKTLKYFISEQSLKKWIKELQQMAALQERQEEEIAAEKEPIIMVSHDEPSEPVNNHEQSLQEDKTTTEIAQREDVEEEAEKRGSLRTENSQLREDKARLEGELEAFRIVGKNMPQVLGEVQKLSEKVGTLTGDNHVLVEVKKRLEETNKDLTKKVHLLEAPKEEPKGFFKKWIS